MKNSSTFQIDLTDEEWMSIISQARDGLPVCCANISELRDELISAARMNGEVVFYKSGRLISVMGWCFPDHDIPPTIAKVAEQIGWTPEYKEHESSGVEYP